MRFSPWAPAINADPVVHRRKRRSHDRLSRALTEIIHARIWAGLHYRTADVQAQILGKKVANYMKKHYFGPLD